MMLLRFLGLSLFKLNLRSSTANASAAVRALSGHKRIAGPSTASSPTILPASLIFSCSFSRRSNLLIGLSLSRIFAASAAFCCSSRMRSSSMNCSMFESVSCNPSSRCFTSSSATTVCTTGNNSLIESSSSYSPSSCSGWKIIVRSGSSKSKVPSSHSAVLIITLLIFAITCGPLPRTRTASLTATTSAFVSSRRVSAAA
mmetsp:Transcript_18171/g.36642  ORF Transcript_18171/g.36642 Transcript_18171/m.36642 type:complete len:200 (-) Transcript_18171:385-984(-)